MRGYRHDDHDHDHDHDYGGRGRGRGDVHALCHFHHYKPLRLTTFERLPF